MTIKDIEKKYKGYHIVPQGYKECIPFSCLPPNYEELEVKGYEVQTKKMVDIDITAALFGGKKKPNKTWKGMVYVWYK